MMSHILYWLVIFPIEAKLFGKKKPFTKGLFLWNERQVFLGLIGLWGVLGLQ